MQLHQHTESSDLSLGMFLVCPASNDTQKKFGFIFPIPVSDLLTFAVKLPANPLGCQESSSAFPRISPCVNTTQVLQQFVSKVSQSRAGSCRARNHGMSSTGPKRSLATPESSKLFVWVFIVGLLIYEQHSAQSPD